MKRKCGARIQISTARSGLKVDGLPQKITPHRDRSLIGLADHCFK